MRNDPLVLVGRLHATPHRAVIAFAGAGSQALAWLHAVGGSSRTVLEATDHYHDASLADALGRRPTRSVAPDVARELALRSLRRARSLTARDDPPGPSFGLGSTATIATDRTKRGEHRAELACADPLGVASYRLELHKGARERAAEEELVSGLLLRAAADASGVLGLADPELGADERLTRSFEPAAPVAAFSASPQRVLTLACDGSPQPGAPERPVGLLSGSFHPVHEGHWRLREAAMRHLERPVLFELPLANAEKDPLALAEARLRAVQFFGRAAILLSHAPLFVDKATRLPGSVFVVGVDTAARVLEPRFYGGGDAMRAALERIRARECRFLVAGRAAEGAFRTLRDLNVPPDVADLFEELPDFRVDLSSRGIRADWPSPWPE